ncbi:unnamed protein product, partial [Prorocentrum cordatum]
EQTRRSEVMKAEREREREPAVLRMAPPCSRSAPASPASEVIKYKAGRRSDIWSLGCTVIEMLTAEAPWPNLRAEKMSVTEMLRRIVDSQEAVPPMPERIPSDCRHFLEKTLVRDHTKRPYTEVLLRHRFVGGGQEAPAVAAAARPSAAPPGAEAAAAPAAVPAPAAESPAAG